MGADGFADDLGEVRVGPVTACEPDEAEAGGQQAAVGQVVDGWHDLVACQVPGDAEEDQAAGTSDPWEALVLRVAQRVVSRRDRGRDHQAPGAEPVPPSAWPGRPSARLSWARPASWSVRCNRRTGRPRSARTCASPPA